MNIILMTILLTLLGVSLVALLVWLGVTSWKSIKFRKQTKKQIVVLQQVIEEHRIESQNSNQSMYDDLSKRIENVEIIIQNRFDEIERKTDSRFDKIHNMIKIISDQMPTPVPWTGK